MNLDSKIFVAGGTGLVGSAIIKNLQEKGYTNIIANYHTRQPIVAPNTSHVAQTNSVRYIRLDLLDSSAVSDFYEQE